MKQSSLPPRKKYTVKKSKVTKKRVNGFWNDPDGISITDALSIGFATLFSVVSIMMFIKLWTRELTNQSIDFFQIFSYPMLVILSGYFGNQIVKNFSFKNLRQNNSTSSPPLQDDSQGIDENQVTEEVVESYEETQTDTTQN